MSKMNQPSIQWEKRLEQVDGVLEQLFSESCFSETLNQANVEHTKFKKQLHDRYTRLEFYKSKVKEEENAIKAIESKMNTSETDYNCFCKVKSILEKLTPFIVKPRDEVVKEVEEEIVSKNKKRKNTNLDTSNATKRSKRIQNLQKQKIDDVAEEK